MGVGSLRERTAVSSKFFPLTLLHSERPKLHRVLGHSECKRVKSRPFLEDFCWPLKQTGSQKLSSFVKMAEKYEGKPIHLNKIQLVYAIPLHSVQCSKLYLLMYDHDWP